MATAPLGPRWPPACRKLLELCGALAQNLNRHLKSLRSERTKAEKAALKGQERKIGVAKSDYLALDWGREMRLKNHLKKSRLPQLV